MKGRTSIGYTGACPDSATAAYPLGNGYRWYSPALMRFLSADSWSPFGAGGVNPYAYCEADPIDHADPSGHVLDFWLGLKFELGARSDAAIPAAAAVEEQAQASTSRAGQGAGEARRGDGPDGALRAGGRKRPAPAHAGAESGPAKRRVPANPEHFDVGVFMADELNQGHLQWHAGPGKVAATWRSPMSRLPYPPVVSERIFNRVGFLMDPSQGAADTFVLHRIETAGSDMQIIYSGTSARSLLEKIEPVSAPRLYDPRYDGRQLPRLLSQDQLATGFADAFAARLAQWNSELPSLDLKPNDFL